MCSLARTVSTPTGFRDPPAGAVALPGIHPFPAPVPYSPPGQLPAHHVAGREGAARVAVEGVAG